MIDVLTRETAAQRIESFADAGRLRQKVWHWIEDGHEIACLLGAIHPSINGADDCPADIMPPWMANLLPPLFDNVSAEKATYYGRRFAFALRHGNTDDRVLREFLIASVDYAVAAATKVQPVPQHDYWAGVKSSCKRVTTLLKNDGTKADLESAARAAYAAARAATYATYAAEVAEAAGAAAGAAADAAAFAARAAARAAAYEHIFDALISAMLATH